MHAANTNPATLAACGARKNDQAGSSIASENIPPPMTIQVSRLLARFAWSEARARLIAELAFRNGRTR